MTTALRQNSSVVRLTRDAVNVEETQDAWVIRQTGLTADGVHNRGRKLAEDLQRTYRLAEGVPFLHDHPGPDELGLVVDRRRVAGWVENVSWAAEPGVVLGDVVLLKASRPGLEILERNVILNRRLVAALQAGEVVEVSIGFWSTDEWLPAPMTHNGAEFDHIQREIIYDHLAAVPQGACSWGTGCGLGRWQQQDRGNVTGESRMADNQNQKPNAHADCAGGADAQRRLDAALQAAADAKAAALEAVGGLESKLNTRLQKMEENGDRLKAWLDQQDKLTEARVLGKRQLLARALNKKADDLPKLDEAALDLMIQRETELRSRADANLILGGQEKQEAKDGIVAGQNGATVVGKDWWKPKAVN